MRPRFLHRLLQTLCLFTAASSVATSALAQGPTSLVVSVPEQKLYVFNENGDEVAKYSVSTSRFGYGDTRGSYNTPLGQLEIASKHGAGAIEGTVFRGCARTGEVVPVNARGRDPIVTRILWLRGKESQNASAYGRCIYIHGTPDEAHIGRKASYGCIRMRSRDIVALFETVSAGTSVEITMDRVGSFFAKAHRPQAVIASAPPRTTEPKVTGAATSTGAVASRPSIASKPSTVASKALAMVTPRPLPGNPAKPEAPVAVASPMAPIGSTSTPILSLSEPLIGAPASEKARQHEEKTAGSGKGRKNRS